MKRYLLNKFLCLCMLCSIGICVFGQSAKKIQVVRNGEVLQEYLTSEIDYIDIVDLVPTPKNVSASVVNKQITISWNAVSNATYIISRSADNVNFSELASGLKQASYVDTKPLPGTNYYRVKAIVNGVGSSYTESVIITMPSSGLNSGIYLGITGFNQTIYSYPVGQLTENSINNFLGFVDNLTMKNGTLLYYSVDNAINTLQSASLPSDLSTAAIVTFTDGLDQGSMMMDVPYEDDNTYLEAINNRIKNEKILGDSITITAYSIGIRGKDVSDIAMFRKNLQMLASASDNATEVTSMSEVNAKFKEIAEKLTQSSYVQTINLKMPGLANGTLVRFTFDNVKSAVNSAAYIEGTFNLKARSLENVKYEGLTSTSGSTIKGTVDGIFVNFTFEKVHTNNNVLIKSEFTDEWTYIASNSSWQINSEFDKTENSDIITERSSAVIMLVLDCSSSLAGDFVKAQTNAKDFINTFYQADDSPGNDNDLTLYSTTPADLSVAVWINGTRYYLTEGQYKNANLSKAIIEGLTVLSNIGNFIISPSDIQSGYVYKEYAMKYYSDVLPDKNQATVISARYVDINNALSKLGWIGFSTYAYMTKSDYDSDWNYLIHLSGYTGGELTRGSSGYIRGVKAIGKDSIVWSDPYDLTLAVKKDGIRYFLSNSDEDLTQYDEVEGVAVVLRTQKFIIRLHNEQSGEVKKTAAMSMYANILPDKEQAEVISMKYSEINRALSKFGGDVFVKSDAYMTKSDYNSICNYLICLSNCTGGKLTAGSSGYIRGVKAF